MKDRNGKEISANDVVAWPGGRRGIVVCCLPAYEHMPEIIRDSIHSKEYKMAGRLYNSAIDRVIVEVERPKSCPLLYTPRPSAVEVVT